MQKEKNITELPQSVPKLSLVKKLSTQDVCVPSYLTVACLAAGTCPRATAQLLLKDLHGSEQWGFSLLLHPQPEHAHRPSNQ